MESLSILLFLAPALCTSFARLRSRIRRLVSPPLDIRTIHTSSYPTTANVDVLLGFCAITVTVLEDNLILVLRFYLTLLLNAFIEVTRIGPIGIVLVRTEHMGENEERKRSRTRRWKRSGGSFSPRKPG